MILPSNWARGVTRRGKFTLTLALSHPGRGNPPRQRRASFALPRASTVASPGRVARRIGDLRALADKTAGRSEGEGGHGAHGRSPGGPAPLGTFRILRRCGQGTPCSMKLQGTRVGENKKGWYSGERLWAPVACPYLSVRSPGAPAPLGPGRGAAYSAEAVPTCRDCEGGKPRGEPAAQNLCNPAQALSASYWGTGSVSPSFSAD